jgi:iron complex outermembrane recepter protein
MRSLLERVLAAVVLPLVLGVAAAAAQPTAASVSSTVTSVDGARLPRATIILTSDASGEQHRSASDNLGAFVLDRLPAGRYTVLVEFPGLTPRVIRDVVAGSEPTRLDVVLEPMVFREIVTVSAAVPRDSVEVTDVRESAARDVGELLGDSPGMWKLRKGAIASDVVVRGLQSRDLNVLIDGERLYGACPNHMDPPSFHVDFSQVERVDVGKGPFDVRYAGSLGGIVNIVTKQPEAGWNASTSLGAGSFGFVNPSATLSYGGARVSALGGASYRRSAPYTDGRGNLMTQGAGYRSAFADSDAFRATTVWGRAAWRPAAGHQVESSYTAQRTDHILYPYLLMDALWDNADRAAVDYSAPAMGWLTGLKAQAYWSRVNHWMTDEFRTSSTSAMRSYSMGTDASTLTVGGRVEARHDATTIGGEVYRRNWNTTTLMGGMAYAPQYSIPDVNVDVAGAFVEHARALTPKVAVDVGGRLDVITSAADAAKANLALYRAYHATDSLSRTDVAPSGRAKATYSVGSGLRVAAAVGHTVRVAEANERFFALRRMGTDWVGNPSLAPARNTGVDLSMTLQRARVTLTANGYVNAVHDYIAVYSAPRQAMVAGVMNAAARSYANVDARLRGFEANGSVRVRPALTVSGDLSYVRGTMTPRPDIGVTATNLAETPPLRGRLRVRLDDGRLFGEVEGVASAAQNSVDRTLGEWTTPSYGIVNLTAGLRRGRLSATVGVANVFNRYYVEHLSFQRDPFRSGLRVAEPGRNLFTNLNWRF